MTDKSIKQVLLDAAEILETQGHTRGTYWNVETGCHCAVGAIYRASGAQFVPNGAEYVSVSGDSYRDYDIVWPDITRDEILGGETSTMAHLSQQAQAALVNALDLPYGVINWNDGHFDVGPDVAPPTSEEVIAGFRAAAATLTD